jgi:hypothetical protein
MKKFPLLVLTVLAPLCSTSLAQRATFSESYADKLISYTEDGDKFFEQITTGRFTTSGRATFAEELDLSTLDESTPVVMTIGNWEIKGTFADDPKFAPGKKSATFKLESGATIRVAFTKKSVTWSVSAKTGNNATEAFEASPKAAEYAESGEPLTITKSDGETLAYAVTLGADNSLAGELPLTGRVRSTIRKVGSGDFAEEYPLMSVNLSASGLLE